MYLGLEVLETTDVTEGLSVRRVVDLGYRCVPLGQDKVLAQVVLRDVDVLK